MVAWIFYTMLWGALLWWVFGMILKVICLGVHGVIDVDRVLGPEKVTVGKLMDLLKEVVLDGLAGPLGLVFLWEVLTELGEGIVLYDPEARLKKADDGDDP